MRRVRWIAIVLTVGLLAVAGGAAVGAPTAVLVAGGVLAVWAVLMLGGFGVALCTFAAAGVALAAIALAEDDAGGRLALGAGVLACALVAAVLWVRGWRRKGEGLPVFGILGG